jgi:hypothetical protein
MRPSEILEESAVKDSVPPCTRLHLSCSVCSESQWTLYPDNDALELKNLPKFYFVCTRHNIPEPAGI